MIFEFFALIFIGMAGAAAIVLIQSARGRLSYRRAELLVVAIGLAGVVAAALLLY